MTTPPLVRRTDRNRVAIIELNRPERKNAIIAPLLDELTEQFVAVDDDPGVGVVVPAPPPPPPPSPPGSG